MTGNLYQDWPVYVLLSVVAFFFIYVVIKGNIQERENKQRLKKEQNKVQDKNQMGEGR